MDEVWFRKYLSDFGTPKKMISDHISRLKRIERSFLDCDLDDEYKKDGCSQLLHVCEKNYDLSKLNLIIVNPLPIGKTVMNTFKFSINKYCQFKKFTSKN